MAYFLQVGSWVCAQSSKAPRENQNKHITDKLEVRFFYNRYLCSKIFDLYIVKKI